MAFDLENFSAKDLDSLIKQASKRKKAINKRKPAAEVRRKLAAAAKADGYSLAELFGGAAPARKAAGKKRTSSAKGKKVAAKYRNPANAKETWSGRGLPPRWLADLIKKGKKREDFLIKK